jgi:hypothetical protein
MAGDIEHGESGGLSRRQMIKASAIAGAAAWTAPVIIDSLSSPAAAFTPPAGGSVNCSKLYVFFLKPGDTTVYWTGYQNTCIGCGCVGTFSSSNLGGFAWNCFTCNAKSFRVNVGQSTSSGATCPTATTAATLVGTPACDTYLTTSSGNVSAQPGVTILGGFSFHAGNVHAFCPDFAGQGNHLIIEDCSDGNADGTIVQGN